MSWVEDLVVFREENPDQVRSKLSVADGVLRSSENHKSYRCGLLVTPSLGDLHRQTAALVAARGGAALRIGQVVADVQQLHQSPDCNGALFQVASQFNLLEMVGPGVPPEHGDGIYERDRTQGPAGAIACGAATIYRNYFTKIGG